MLGSSKIPLQTWSAPARARTSHVRHLKRICWLMDAMTRSAAEDPSIASRSEREKAHDMMPNARQTGPTRCWPSMNVHVSGHICTMFVLWASISITLFSAKCCNCESPLNQNAAVVASRRGWRDGSRYWSEVHRLNKQEGGHRAWQFAVIGRGGAEIDLEQASSEEEDNGNEGGVSDDDTILFDEYEDEYEYDREEYDDQEESSNVKSSAAAASTKSQSSKHSIDTAIQSYDEPIIASPMNAFMVQLGVMMMCRKLDMNDPKMVKIARFTFIGYIVLVHLFTIYVRFRAKALDNRTIITLESPMVNLVKSQINNVVAGKGNTATTNTIKTLTNRFLSSQTTIREYDMNQANQMRNGLLFPLILMWIMHFKFGQVQPLLLTVAMGIASLVQSPLFQVYVLGRKLERPFKNPNPLEQRLAESTAINNNSESTAESDGDDAPKEEEEDVNVEAKDEEQTEEERDSDDDASE